MSKIQKHKDNIYNFITSKSSFSNIFDKELIKEFVESDYCLFAIILISIFNIEIKKNKIKSYHTLHIASSIILMIISVCLNENKIYYENKFGIENIENIQNQITIFIFEEIQQNGKTMENALGEEKSLKIQKKISDILHDKLLLITKKNKSKNNINTLKIKRSDIIKYKFEDKNIIEEKYKKLKRISKEEILVYMNEKFGSLGQCAFLFGWLLGFGSDDEKNLETISNLGNSFGILVKLIMDFNLIESNIKSLKENDISYNFVVNYGIHECFRLYDEHKVKFLEGCILNDIYNTQIKEIIEKIEKVFDKCLKNTELELTSQYSSFNDN